MKYTKIAGAVHEVKGCTTCPHKVDVSEEGVKFMRCVMKIKVQIDGSKFKIQKRSSKLIGKWTGAYHASCPLPSDAQGPFREILEVSK